MCPPLFVGVAVVGLIIAAPMSAEVRGQWQPADCANVEAKSLEAELLKCDPALLGSAAAEARFSAVETEDDAASLPNTLATSSSTSQEVANLGTQVGW